MVWLMKLLGMKSMCRCVNKRFTSERFMSELRYLVEMREIMAGPNLPKRKSVYDMEYEELELFKKEVEEWKNTK